MVYSLIPVRVSVIVCPEMQPSGVIIFPVTVEVWSHWMFDIGLRVNVVGVRVGDDDSGGLHSLQVPVQLQARFLYRHYLLPLAQI
jgi:hypothetical protein